MDCICDLGRTHTGQLVQKDVSKIKGYQPSWGEMHSELSTLINGEFRSLKHRLLSDLFPRLVFKKEARRFVKQYAMLGMSSIVTYNKVSVVLPPCSNRIKSVQRMQTWLNQHIKDDQILAILHGSLGVDEVIPYSDFDALVIIKDKVIKDSKQLARVAHYLFQSRRFMYELDPLQHHGWFVLSEKALFSWPEYYLPIEVLKHSTVLTESKPVKLRLSIEFDNKYCKTVLLKLLQSLKREVTTGSCFLNLYQFKSTISKVLLLPAFYVQVRDCKGVFKRDSFDLAKSDFPQKEWLPVDVASAIRKQWPKLKRKWPNFLTERPGLLGDSWRKKHSQQVPVKFCEQFNEEVLNKLQSLILSMERSISKY